MKDHSDKKRSRKTDMEISPFTVMLHHNSSYSGPSLHSTIILSHRSLIHLKEEVILPPTTSDVEGGLPLPPHHGLGRSL